MVRTAVSFLRSIRFTLILILVLAPPGRSCRAQEVRASVSNVLRYGSGWENSGEGGFVGTDRKEYLDNFADARFSINNVTVGLRFDLREPPEYGVPFRGIRKRYVEYESDGLSLRAGDMWGLFSRGLSLNLFEDRNLGFDNGLDGIRAQYRNKYFEAAVLGGTIDFVDPVSIGLGALNREQYMIRGGSVECKPLGALALGGSYVWSRAEFPVLTMNGVDTSFSQIPELFVSGRIGSLSVLAEYAQKLTRLHGIDSSRGGALYLSASQTGEGYGVTFEYKDYRFDVVDPVGRQDYRPTRMLPFQNPPTVVKEHSFTLLTRDPHVIDFNDEVGFQIDAFVQPDPTLTVNVNGSFSSRHYGYSFDPRTFAMKTVEHGTSWLPSFADERSPFWEFYAELEYFYLGEYADDSYLKLGFDRRVLNTFELFNPLSPVQPFRITGVPVKVQYLLWEVWSISVTSEHEWVSKFRFPDQYRYYNHLLSVSIAHSPDISFGCRYEITTNEYEANGDARWLVVEAGYRIKTSHIITISYGAERGGQVCSNGICRVINPFTGVRFSILSHF